jgi:multidrug transporter EmrE-like cation transporter
MQTCSLIPPIALLVANSQIVAKWRSNGAASAQSLSVIERMLKFVSDPVILSAYAAALPPSFVWLFVITKLPLNVAFPVYIGITFAMLLFGGWILLSEVISRTSVLAMLLIFAGAVLGAKS